VVEAAYRTDLAHVHDAGFGLFAENAAPVAVELLRRSRLHSGLVVELGCGSGISSGIFAAAGYDVLGIDLSPKMLAIARKRVPGAQFRQESFVTAEIPPCIAVTAFGEIFNYLFDTENNEKSLYGLFRRVYEALNSGGLLIFDGAEPGRVPGGGPLRRYFDGDDWAALVETEENRRQRMLTRRITSFRKVGRLYRRDHEVHRLRLFNRRKLLKQLRTIGFRVHTLPGYGSWQFPPGYVAFVARKTGA
jgi:SAM-dependent methyltransferase